MLGADHRAVTPRPRAAPQRRDAPVIAQGLPGGWAEPGARPTIRSTIRPTIRSTIRGTGILGFAALSLGSLAASPATSAEWVVGGSVSQGVVAESNQDLDPDDAEPIYGATTSFGLDFAALTPTTQWQFETGAAFSVFGGAGADEGLDGAFPNFAAAVAHDGKYVDTGASFAIDYAPVAFAQLDDTGFTEGDATQLSVRLAADAAYALDALNSLTVGGFGRIIRFPSGTTTLEPNTSYGGNIGWARVLTPATQANVSFGVSRFTSEEGDDQTVVIIDDQDGPIFVPDELDFDDEDSLSFSLSAGVGHAVNPRLAVNASLGVTAARTTETFFGREETDFSVGPSGGLDIAWQPEADTQVVFALSQGFEPSSLGELQSTTAIGLGLQHAINNWASAGVNVLLQRQTDVDGGRFEDESDEPRLYGTVSPSIAFALTEDWALQAGYIFRVQREDGAGATSNGVFMTVTRAFDILP